MLTFARAYAAPRVFAQLTGLSITEFDALRPAFAAAYADDLGRRHARQGRKRRPGAGRRSALATPDDKLFFLLFYFRHYPTQEVLAFLFGFSQGQANRWLHRLTPLVNRALGYQLHLPARDAAGLAALLGSVPGLGVILDGTERPVRRPQDAERQKADYSGKKKRHTKKNIVVTDKGTGKVLGLGATRPGSAHDKRCVDEEGYTFPSGTKVYQDTGFQGYAPPGAEVVQPKKKPRGKELTPEEKASNRGISRERIGVEHSIGGVKVFGIVSDVFRNLKEGFVDLVMETACGLFNLRKTCRAAN
jgi:hypothetical protein